MLAAHRLMRKNTKGTMDPKGARLLTYCTICLRKPRLCINIHHHAPPLIVLQQAAALHAQRRQYLTYINEGSLSSFESIT